ncbi:MAG: hypothetical protein NTW73_02290 [Candidatus Parcubacteria bacterium]|nr:hypothetical protein [Candidatus Parcubacteria bacterium]
MFNILPVILIFLALAGLIVIFVRKNKIVGSEKILQEDIQKSGSRNKYFEKTTIVLSSSGKVISYFLISVTEKSVHRLKIISLRLDNFFSRMLHSIRKQKGMSEISGMPGTNKPDLISAMGRLATDKEDQSDLDKRWVDDIKKYQQILKKNNQDLSAIKNLSRIYLIQNDFSSARMTLIEGYRLDQKDEVINSLLIEIWERKEDI